MSRWKGANKIATWTTSRGPRWIQLFSWSSDRMEILSLSVTGKLVASNTFVFIDSEPHPGLNIYYFLLVQRCHYACQKFKIPQQSTGGAERHACRTPHFHTHSDCTACVVQTHHATRAAQHIWIVCHKKFVIRALCLIPCCTLHRTLALPHLLLQSQTSVL